MRLVRAFGEEILIRFVAIEAKVVEVLLFRCGPSYEENTASCYSSTICVACLVSNALCFHRAYEGEDV